MSRRNNRTLPVDLPVMRASHFVHRRVAVLLVVVLLVKVWVLWQLKDHILLQPDAGLDTTAYLSLARRVAAGDVLLGPGLYFVSPLYIYFAGATLAAANSVTSIRLAQIVLGTAAVGLIWWTARQWAGDRAAWIAAIAAALTGLFTFYEVLLLQAAIDPFLTALSLAALTGALRGSGSLWFVAAGALFGLQSLNRPNVLIAVAGLSIATGLVRGRRAALAMVAGVLLAMAPLSLRNIAAAGDWLPAASHGGLNFYIGNNPDADGTYVHIPDITPSITGQQQDARRVAERAAGHALSDSEVSSYFYRRSVEWFRRRPADAVRLFGRKLWYTFNAAHLPLNYSYPFYAYDARTPLRFLVAGPWLLIPLGLTGLGVLAWKQASAFRVWVAFVPLYVVSVAVFFMSERYRLPLLVPLCIGTGAALDVLWRDFAARRLRHAAGLLGVTAMLALAANWPPGLDDGRAEERTRMAERLAQLGRFEDAAHWAASASAIHVRPAVVEFRVGRALYAAGRLDQAIAHLEQATYMDPERAETSYALGQALLDAGKPADAIPHLRRAFDASVRADVAGYDLARALAATGARRDALEVLRRVTPDATEDAASWFRLGQLARQLGDGPLAADRYRQAARSAPRWAEPREQLGLLLVLTGDDQAGIKELEAATAADGSDATAHLNLAVAYARVGRIDDARSHAREALRLDPAYTRAADLIKALGG